VGNRLIDHREVPRIAGGSILRTPGPPVHEPPLQRLRTEYSCEVRAKAF
jgi:hypothetical protein